MFSWSPGREVDCPEPSDLKLVDRASGSGDGPWDDSDDSVMEAEEENGGVLIGLSGNVHVSVTKLSLRVGKFP